MLVEHRGTAMGTEVHLAAEGLDPHHLEAAFEQILDWGVAHIAETLSARTAQLAEAVRPLGLRDATPDRAPHYLCLALPDGAPEDLVARLAARDIYISQRGDRLRVTPHLYNDTADIDRFVDALKAEL